MSKKKKLLLIGWDAADWKVINPLLDKGLMPNLCNLIEGGVIGNLETLDPAYSPMLWTSIATGKRPYQHGILGFTEVSEDGERVRPVLSSSRKVRAVWDILSEYGYKTHVVGWWPSHPAEKMNGISISNLFQKETGGITDKWELAPNSVHPEAFSDFYAQFRVHPEELTLEHLLPFIPDALTLIRKKDKRINAIAKITSHASSLHAAFTNIIRTQEWDFAALYLDAIDHYCHGFMKYHPPKQEHIIQQDYDFYKDVVTAGYRFHDMMLGRLLDLAGDATIMLISDHGFQPDHLRPKNIPHEPAGPAFEHSPFGIFCMKGEGIKKDEIIYGAGLLDISPTILKHFDLPTARDMDGKVLLNAFEKDKTVQFIDSYETSKFNTNEGSSKLDIDVETAMLKQLQDLGYIKSDPVNIKENIKHTQDECTFNLIRSYLDGGKIKEALPLLEKLHSENPDVTRYSFRLAVLYQMTGEYRKCRKIIDELRTKEIYNKNVLDVVEGCLLIGEKRPLQALKLFKASEEKLNANEARLYFQIANCYAMLNRYDDAERAVKKQIEIDFDFPEAHQMLGAVYLSTKRFEEAANSLLQAIGLRYYLPNAHIMLGRSLAFLGKYEDSATALEIGLGMRPGNNKAREFLIELYKTHLNREEKVESHLKLFRRFIKGQIIVVSGIPRSGTSMVMKMLQKGGCEIFTDNKRNPDENNPEGFFEHEKVKDIKQNKSWLKDCVGKAVKIVVPLVNQLPGNFKYKIIFVERSIDEVIRSQQKMKLRLNKEKETESVSLLLKEKFLNTIKQTKKLLESQRNVEILYLEHHEIIKDPFANALLINEFLDYKLMPELMAGAVNESLHREKSRRLE